MELKSYSVSIPGSLMLFGEHAVLEGKLAIVCAIDKYMHIELIPKKDQNVTINSSIGHYKSQISDINVEKPFQFVLSAILEYEKCLPCGFELNVKSDFSDKIGMGSSAAVTVGTVCVLEQWLSKSYPKKIDLFRLSKKIVLKVQGKASGADVAASIYSGIIAYRMRPFFVEKLKNKPSLEVLYSGKKTSTIEVIEKVYSKKKKYPEIYKKIYLALEWCSKKAKDAINSKNWKELGEIMNINQGLQEAMGTSDEVLSSLINDLRKRKNICGAKISGAGLGDCVIGLKNE